MSTWEELARRSATGNRIWDDTAQPQANGGLWANTPPEPFFASDRDSSFFSSAPTPPFFGGMPPAPWAVDLPPAPWTVDQPAGDSTEEVWGAQMYRGVNDGDPPVTYADDGSTWEAPEWNASVSPWDLGITALDMAEGAVPGPASPAESLLGAPLKFASGYGDFQSAAARDEGDPRARLERTMGILKVLDGSSDALGVIHPRVAPLCDAVGPGLGFMQGLTETTLGVHNINSSDEADQLAGTRQLMKGPASAVGDVAGGNVKAVTSAWVLGVDVGSMLYDNAEVNRAAQGEEPIADYCSQLGMDTRDEYLAQFEEPSRRQLRVADRRGLAETTWCSWMETMAGQFAG
jgi:hypothetical protein